MPQPQAQTPVEDDWSDVLDDYNPGYSEADAAVARARLEGTRRQREQTFGEIPALNAIGWHGIADIDEGASKWGMADNVISTLGEAGWLGSDVIMSGIDAVPGVDVSNPERERRWRERGEVSNRVGEFFGDVGGALEHAAMNPVSEWGDDVARSASAFGEGLGEATRGRTPLQIADDFLAITCNHYFLSFKNWNNALRWNHDAVFGFNQVNIYFYKAAGIQFCTTIIHGPAANRFVGDTINFWFNRVNSSFHFFV